MFSLAKDIISTISVELLVWFCCPVTTAGVVSSDLGILTIVPLNCGAQVLVLFCSSAVMDGVVWLGVVAVDPALALVVVLLSPCCCCANVLILLVPMAETRKTDAKSTRAVKYVAIFTYNEQF